MNYPTNQIDYLAVFTIVVTMITGSPDQPFTIILVLYLLFLLLHSVITIVVDFTDTGIVLQVPRLLIEVLHGPLTEAAHMQGLGPGGRLGLRHDSAPRQGLGPGQGSGHWLTYARPLHRLREFGLVGVHVGVLDKDCVSDQELAPATMHR